MSRLQVDGLAWVINDPNPDAIGRVVKLVGYFDVVTCKLAGIERYDMWEIDYEGKDSNSIMAAYSKNLMPLGDKQTQDELAKEVEEV